MIFFVIYCHNSKLKMLLVPSSGDERTDSLVKGHYQYLNKYQNINNGISFHI